MTLNLSACHNLCARFVCLAWCLPQLLDWFPSKCDWEIFVCLSPCKHKL